MTKVTWVRELRKRFYEFLGSNNGLPVEFEEADPSYFLTNSHIFNYSITLTAIKPWATLTLRDESEEILLQIPIKLYDEEAVDNAFICTRLFLLNFAFKED